MKFQKDGALSGKRNYWSYFVCGKIWYFYTIDLSTPQADKNGGSNYSNASAAGINECLAIKCSEDCYMTNSKGKGVEENRPSIGRIRWM